MVTYVFENVSAALVALLVLLSKPVFPAGDVLNVTQNRLCEKTFARQAGLGVANFSSVTSRDELDTTAWRMVFRLS